MREAGIEEWCRFGANVGKKELEPNSKESKESAEARRDLEFPLYGCSSPLLAVRCVVFVYSIIRSSKRGVRDGDVGVGCDCARTGRDLVEVSRGWEMVNRKQRAQGELMAR